MGRKNRKGREANMNKFVINSENKKPHIQTRPDFF
jgi:hypothetical protein